MRGGFGVTCIAVLWSPVGAPAGVPGPRRNADECDAGWFAPVATRRRPNLRWPPASFATRSQYLPGGGPPEVALIFDGLRPASLRARSTFPGGTPPDPPRSP